MSRASPHAIDAVSPTFKAPLYHQIFLILRNGILSEEFKVGSTLPTEHDVASLYGVSRITARRALSELALAGFVSRARGRGTTVEYKPAATPLRGSVAAWLEGADAMGRTTTVKILEFGYGPCTPEEAKALALPAGAEVQQSVRVRSFGKSPISLLVTALPAKLGRSFDRAGLARTPLLALLRQSGVKIGHARQMITATLANQSMAARLATEIGAPLLKVQRVVYDTADRPIEFLTAYYRPDRYHLEMELTPEQALADVGSAVKARPTQRKRAAT